MADELTTEGFLHADESPTAPERGVALCCSGGGYRATLFHLGAIWRLNELGALGSLQRISSVSGGSITAAALGVEWRSLNWSVGEDGNRRASQEEFQLRVVEPLRHMTATSIDVGSILWGTLKPWTWISDEVAKHYNRVVFHNRTLQDLPSDADGPRFVINATNVKTGSLWRFSKPYIADYRVGMIERPSTPLALAVTASSAFPPVLSPMRMTLDPTLFKPDVPNVPVDPSLRNEAILTDGGVYDNLGIETAWKRYTTVLVSDAGRKMDDDLSPQTDWVRHSRRLIDLLQHQTSNLRRRQVIGAFTDPQDAHDGTYWGIQSDLASYQVANGLQCPHDKTLAIASIPTRLQALSDRDQERIINWGYAVSDAAIRRHLPSYATAPSPTEFPYRHTGLV